MSDPAAGDDRIRFEGLKPDELLGLYSEVMTGVRETDSISFKLLGFIPVVSGAGAVALTFILQNPAIGLGPVTILAALGALSTFGVYLWERRNIQTCNRMRDRAAALETKLGFRDLADLEAAPRLLATPIGKTEAVAFIYAAATGAWLAPVVAAVS